MQAIPPVVVGRWGVDSGLMIASHNEHVSIVDMTHLVSYHQGINKSQSQRLRITEKDWNYNFKFVDRDEIRKSGALLSNYLITSKVYKAY